MTACTQNTHRTWQDIYVASVATVLILRDEPSAQSLLNYIVMERVHRVIIGLLLLLAAFVMFGCKTTKCIPTTEYVTRDSIVAKYHTDSVLVTERDSVFVREKGDTVFVSVTKWRVRDHIVNHTDTVYKDREHTVVQTEVQEVVPGYYKSTSAGFWVLLAILVVLIAWGIFKKVYLHK